MYSLRIIRGPDVGRKGLKNAVTTVCSTSFSVHGISSRLIEVVLFVCKESVCDTGLRPLACWDCGFESHRGRGCLSVVSVACCQVEVSATSRSLLQRSHTDWCVVVCDLETLWMRRPWPTGGVLVLREKEKKKAYIVNVHDNLMKNLL